MPLPPRVTALLVSLLLAQLTLVGTAAPCGVHDPSEHPGEPGGGPATHPVMTGTGTGVQGAATGSGCSPCEAPADHSAPCDFPWSPGLCSTMLSCAVAMTAVAPVAPMPPAPGDAHGGAAGAVAPPNPTSAPELPPPRA